MLAPDVGESNARNNIAKGGEIFHSFGAEQKGCCDHNDYKVLKSLWGKSAQGKEHLQL